MAAGTEWAVIKDGGRQYVVSVGDTIYVDHRSGPLPEVMEFESLLAVRKGKEFRAGKSSAGKVIGEVRGRALGEKSVSYMYKRRKGSHTKKGHRQKYIEVKITEISTK